MNEMKKPDAGSPGPENISAAAPTTSAPVPGPPPVQPASVEPASSGSPERDSETSKVVSAPDPREIDRWNQQVRDRMRRQSRRGFIGLGAGLAAGIGLWSWIITRREVEGTPWPLRKALEVNEQLAYEFLGPKRVAPQFGKDRISPGRVNGDEGLSKEIDVNTWRLQVEGLAAQSAPLSLTLDDIRKLPRIDMTTQLNCIEGWTVVVEWAGARFTDFMKAFPPETVSGDEFSPDSPEDWPPFVGMETPDRGYYVGLDMESMAHPQTLLCYEQNGEPLSQKHGAPLRLVIPVKYGVKSIKRIGTIRYTTRRPADYWAEQGYDWYIGL